MLCDLPFVDNLLLQSFCKGEEIRYPFVTGNGWEDENVNRYHNPIIRNFNLLLLSLAALPVTASLSRFYVDFTYFLSYTEQISCVS